MVGNKFLGSSVIASTYI